MAKTEKRLMLRMGLDCGSTTCKLVTVDERDHLVYRDIVPIKAEPLEAVLHLIAKFKTDLATIGPVGVTGSARNLISKCLRIPCSKSEIIAHAFGAIRTFGEVASIIEIGGQDSKFMKLSDNIIDTFRMNSVCAAGTGSFLEWQAERLGLSIEELDRLALESTRTLDISGKCAVFIESAIVNRQRMGEPKADIASSICNALARNYLNELCKGEVLESPIVFQGGVARLSSMRRSFEKLIGKPVLVHEDCAYMGAYGIALITSCEGQSQSTPDLDIFKHTAKHYEREACQCHDCPRECELVRFTDPVDGSVFHVGGRCGRN